MAAVRQFRSTVRLASGGGRFKGRFSVGFGEGSVTRFRNSPRSGHIIWTFLKVIFPEDTVQPAIQPEIPDIAELSFWIDKQKWGEIAAR